MTPVCWRLLTATALVAGGVGWCDPAHAQISGTPPPPGEVSLVKAPDEAGGVDRVYEVAVPLSVNGRWRGQVPIRASLTTLEAVDVGRLADAIGDFGSEETIAQLRALAAGFASAATVRAAGLSLVYDPAALELRLDLPPDAQGVRLLDFTEEEARYEGYRLTDPAWYALGIDTDLSVSHDLNGGGDPRATLAFDGFSNIGGIDGLYAEFGATVDIDGNGSREPVTRDQLTLFKDFREQAVRFSGADVWLDPQPLAGAPGFLGFAAERRYDDIRPDRVTRALGARSLTLLRRSTVEIFINGAMVRRFVAEPGPLQLADIPFTDVGNEVTIVVEDDQGRREVDSFAFATHERLLEPGLSEFGVAGGFLQRAVTDGLDWNTDEIGGQAYFRYGMTPRATLGTTAFASEEMRGATGSVTAALPLGVAQLDGGLSNNPFGTGFAASLIYQSDFNGVFDRPDGLDLRLSFESDSYLTLADDPVTDSRHKTDIAAAYRLSIDDVTSATLSAGYAESSGREVTRAGIGISRRFGQAVMSLLAQKNFGDDTEGRLFASLSFPLGPRTRGRTSYSTANNTVVADVSRAQSGRAGDYGYRLRAERDDDGYELFGDADYIGNRFDATASLYRGAPNDRSPLSGAGPMTGKLRLGSGIAIADGVVGVGRSVSNGFVMLEKHPTLGDATLSIENRIDEAPLARTDALGPAVAPMRSGYRISEIAIGVADAPVGYDFGEGLYATRPGAHSGVVLTIGNDAYRSAQGIALDANGEPVVLKYGRVVPSMDGQGIDIFTNRSGRFVASGLAPGLYRLEIDGRFAEFTIEEGSDAWVELGELETR